MKKTIYYKEEYLFYGGIILEIRCLTIEEAYKLMKELNCRAAIYETNSKYIIEQNDIERVFKHIRNKYKFEKF